MSVLHACSPQAGVLCLAKPRQAAARHYAFGVRLSAMNCPMAEKGFDTCTKFSIGLLDSHVEEAGPRRESRWRVLRCGCGFLWRSVRRVGRVLRWRVRLRRGDARFVPGVLRWSLKSGPCRYFRT